jgi:hypothetical protein
MQARKPKRPVIDEPLPPDTEWALVDPETGKALVVVLPDEAEEDLSEETFEFWAYEAQWRESRLILTRSTCPFCGSLLWFNPDFSILLCGSDCVYEGFIGEGW